MAASQPLAGKHIVVTRARAQAHELSEPLRALGAIPIEWPMIEIAPPADFAPLDRALKQVMHYDWLVFSSANGVKYFWGRIDDCQLRFPRIAAVGDKTAQALRANGLRVDAMPKEFLATEIMGALGEVANQKILLVRPEVAPADLPSSLRERGAQVDEVVAYRTLPAHYEQPFSLQDIDAITLASASAASNLARYAPRMPETVCVASIGPSTARAARAAGLRVDIEARLHTVEGLVLALVAHFNSREVSA
ncbi:MAG: uroporphyrinogen-III synthase [Chloroflexi bacterium]|nr:uroporphyrinogen-III synthase [Chloroflexota bacterium]MBI3733042.1 uroporphyrinogen-III synthase [Chloroflexota bacterium]